ncbi:hypothetical protein Vretimale_2510 [Volvox reticuliferus]|uniref:Uncharacterized protein n=2 Tax=Volvox reticuliferus TaxID=1737510 RepID=A0A8J4G324_9CHLO|nr:hypothetical protein Vretifemale_4873 [Volvox reticuliferus]GIL96835.1 hypothetical protein Vretimale_2510 [Volvox reticuliferus]
MNMDRQQLPIFDRQLQQLDDQRFYLDHKVKPPLGLDALDKGANHQLHRVLGGKENNFSDDGGVAGKSEYIKDRQPGRSILRKAEGPGLQTLQSKFSILQDDVISFNANKSSRRDSLSGRGGIPVPSQPPSQQATVPAPAGAASAGLRSAESNATQARPTETAEAPWRPLQIGAEPALPQQHKSVAPAQDPSGSRDDDRSLGPPASKEGLIRMPAGNLANTKAAKAAQEAFEEPAFLQSCTEGLTWQLQRTKDGATDKSRIQELAELVKLLRKCLKEMGSRATAYVDKCASFERECAQQVENISLASQTSLKQVEAELATARTNLAAAERDYKNAKAQLGLHLDAQKAEVSRLLRDVERLTEERDQAREDATRTEQQRQQLELELRELRKAASQQQRDLSVSQSEALRVFTEEKIMLENRLNSLRDDHSKQSTTLKGLQECVDAYEQENRMLRLRNDQLTGSLASRDSLAAMHQEQAAKVRDALSQAQQQLANLTVDVERLRTERSTLEAFVEEQATELDNQRSRATTLENTLAQERNSWQEMQRILEASLSDTGNQKSLLAREVAEVTAALSAVTAQKDAAENSAAHLARDKAALLREHTNLQHQLEFAEGRANQMEQEVAALRGQADAIKAELEASRQLVGEKESRLEQLEGEFAALKEVLGDTTASEGESGKQIVMKLLSKIASLQHAAVAAEAVRRQLHNALVDLRGNIRVYCRVKPHPTPATRLGSDGTSIAVAVEGREHSFNYDRVFGPDSTQEQVFGAVSELVQSALDGFHVCVFSYGQTGAGKTHTMQGGDTPTSRGIIPRALEQILANARKLEEEAEWAYTMHASCIEVYNQTLRDLLSQGTTIQDNNAIKHDFTGGHTTVSGARMVKVTDMEGATELVRQAAEARAVVATAMNAASSRSHWVFMLNITGWHSGTGTRLQGSLCLVDLAGSERLDRSQAEGAAKKEACAINSSLSALGDVFAALSSKSSHVPYRNSKLTYLLQPCLGGNGKTLMFVNINPEPASASESLCSLRFAAKVNGCETGAKGGARRNIQTYGSGGSSELEPSNPAGARFSLGSLPRPSGGMETSSAPVSRRTSMVPLRPGVEGARAKPTPGGLTTTGLFGNSVGVKRPGGLLDKASKRTKS